jgi:molybdate transport system permease protein
MPARRDGPPPRPPCRRHWRRQRPSNGAKARYVAQLHSPTAAGTKAMPKRPPPTELQASLTMLEVAWLTVKLAGITTILLLVLATPLAWWLARAVRAGRRRRGAGGPADRPAADRPGLLPADRPGAAQPADRAAAPVRGPHPGLHLPGPGDRLADLFPALRRPAAAQRLHRRSATSRWRRPPPWGPRLERVSPVALPLALPGYAVAAILAFAHTVGEFGVVMMLGGGIPGRDRGAVDRDLPAGRGPGMGQGPPAGRRAAGLRLPGDAQPAADGTPRRHPRLAP